MIITLNRQLAKIAADIRLHDWSDSPYRADRAGHQRSLDGNKFDSELIVWTAGNGAVVPDLASPVPGPCSTPSTRTGKGKLLARNIIATLRGRKPKNVHYSPGAIATLGLGLSLASMQHPREAFVTGGELAVLAESDRQAA